MPISSPKVTSKACRRTWPPRCFDAALYCFILRFATSTVCANPATPAHPATYNQLIPAVSLRVGLSAAGGDGGGARLAEVRTYARRQAPGERECAGGPCSLPLAAAGHATRGCARRATSECRAAGVRWKGRGARAAVELVGLGAAVLLSTSPNARRHARVAPRSSIAAASSAPSHVRDTARRCQGPPLRALRWL